MVATVNASTSAGVVITPDNSGVLAFQSSSATALTIDASQNVGIGTSSIADTSSTGTVLEIYGGANAAHVHFTNSATGQTAGDGFIVGTGVGTIDALLIQRESANMIFRTADTEQMRIDSAGRVLFGTTNGNPGGTAGAGGISLGGNNDGNYYAGVIQASALGNASLVLNRSSDDGNIVIFKAQENTEGTISVSGTTVSYNGGHLARYSQLPTGQRDNAILKGTVMSNLDAMCEWLKDGEPTPNEQLNKMKVSDVEGDKNVAGVFVNWDNDDKNNTFDMNIAMTGDMIIRIAQGVTVQRGDLLMSAGNGTAKTQEDDIVRSKTIAKVTSTHVTCTYADGSYCVPCVLMAC